MPESRRQTRLISQENQTALRVLRSTQSVQNDREDTLYILGLAMNRGPNMKRCNPFHHTLNALLGVRDNDGSPSLRTSSRSRKGIHQLGSTVTHFPGMHVRGTRAHQPNDHPSTGRAISQYGPPSNSRGPEAMISSMNLSSGRLRFGGNYFGLGRWPNPRNGPVSGHITAAPLARARWISRRCNQRPRSTLLILP